MQLSKLDIVDYLDSKEMIAEYLNTVLEEGDDSDVIDAIGHIAKTIGMSKISEETGLSKQSLYKALSAGSKPQFGTMMKVLKVLGVQIHVNAISDKSKVSPRVRKLRGILQSDQSIDYKQILTEELSKKYGV